MHAPQISSRVQASRNTAVFAVTASHSYSQLRHCIYYKDYSCRALPRVLAAAASVTQRHCAMTTSAPRTLCRLISSDPPRGTHRLPTVEQKRSYAIHNGKERVPNAPKWVSMQKQNGERRMSVSIRSGPLGQRERRFTNVAPYAPPPSSSSVHPFSTVRQAEHDAGVFTGNVVKGLSELPQQSSSMYESGQGASSELTSSVIDDVGSSHLSGGRKESSANSAFSFSECSTTSPDAAVANPTSSIDVSEKRLSSNQNGQLSPLSDTSANAKRTEDEASTAKTSAAATPPPGAASTSSSTFSSSSHPLLYSVSRFTEPVKRIILIRNGRSEANEDVAAYVHTPDWRIPLVEEGKRESVAAGRALSELAGDDPVYFYYSPYIRSRQSLRYVLQGYDEARLSGRQHAPEWWEEEGEGDMSFAPYSEGGGTSGLGGLPLEAAAGVVPISGEGAGCCGDEVTDAVLTDLTTDAGSASYLQKDASLVLDQGTSDNIIGVREDVRLRDGDIGRYTSVDELMHHLLERERYGKFFYRFPYGESGADVCDRVTSFLDAFQRERVEFPMNTNVVIITHGLTMRMFIKRWFHLTVETFHRMKSPPPGSLCTLTRLHHRSCFRLDESCVELMHLPLSLNEYNGYKYRNKQLLGSMSSGAPYM